MSLVNGGLTIMVNGDDRGTYPLGDVEAIAIGLNVFNDYNRAIDVTFSDMVITRLEP